MGDRQIWYHIREGFRSIFTHGLMSIAAVCMTVACLLIMGSFSLIAINANHVLGDLEDDNQFLAYIDDSLTRAQATLSPRRRPWPTLRQTRNGRTCLTTWSPTPFGTGMKFMWWTSS